MSTKPAPTVPPKYTPVEQRIVDALSDGERHAVEDLSSCLYDEMAGSRAVAVHVHSIRRKLPPGEYLVCEISYGRCYYRHVLHLSSRNGSPNR